MKTITTFDVMRSSICSNEDNTLSTITKRRESLIDSTS